MRTTPIYNRNIVGTEAELTPLTHIDMTASLFYRLHTSTIDTVYRYKYIRCLLKYIFLYRNVIPVPHCRHLGYVRILRINK
jgi:hypothetical protein